MTSSQFQMLRMLGRIAPNARVRTVLFKFNGSSHEWAEIFIQGQYSTIQQQEDEFRRRFSFCQFITPEAIHYPGESTVAAKDWVFI